jgi:two-component system sensor kinase FixL
MTSQGGPASASDLNVLLPAAIGPAFSDHSVGRRSPLSGITLVVGFVFGVSIPLFSGRAGAPDDSLLRTLLVVGGMYCAGAVTSATWFQRRSTLISALAAAAFGGLALIFLAIGRDGAQALWPPLRRAAEMSQTPPGSVGAFAAAGVSLVLAGVAGVGVVAGSVERRALAAFYLRLCVVAQAFFQFSHEALGGHFSTFFAKPWVLAEQALLAMAAVSLAIFLIRNDRSWLRFITNEDQTLPVARMDSPITLMNIVVGYYACVALTADIQSGGALIVALMEVLCFSLFSLLFFNMKQVWRARRDRDVLSYAVDTLPVFVFSRRDGISYWSSGCEKLFGWTFDEVQGRTVGNVLKPTPPIDPESALGETPIWDGELKVRDRRGGAIWAQTRLVRIGSADQPHSRIIATMLDLSELKSVNRALEHQKQTFAEVSAIHSLGVIDWDPVSRTSVISAELARMLGVNGGEAFIDREDLFGSMMLPTDRKAGEAQIARDLAQGAERSMLSLRIRRGDGSTLHLSGALYYRYAEEGAITQVVGVYMDVTQQNRALVQAAEDAQRVVELQTQLNQLTRMSAIGEMSASLAHELNQPLTAVCNAVGALYMILRDNESRLDPAVYKRAMRAARHAEEQAMRSGEIIKRVREFIARSDHDVRCESLFEIIEDALALARTAATFSQVDLRLSGAAGEAEVMVNRLQIQQVILNLIRNSVEAMHDQTGVRIIEVSCEVRGGSAWVAVEDNGPGITPDRVDKLFMPTISTEDGGLGLGLPFCRRIVEGFGGELWLDRAGSGQGARFVLTLPLIETGESNAAA